MNAKFDFYARALKIARENQPDPEAAADALERAGVDYRTARAALRSIFGYDVLERT